MPVSSSTEHWIKPDALTINLNHFGDPDYLQVSVLAGAVVMAFKQDVIGYNAAHNYRTWPLEAANTYLETSSAVNVYAKLTRSEVNARALIVYDTILRDIEGREITYEKNEETGEVKEILGEPDINFYFIFLGQLSSSISEDGRSVLREWTSEYRSGSLETNEQQNDWMVILNKMFRPHYDDPLNPDILTWIEAKAHMGIAGGLTSFIDNGSLKLPSIYDGLPIDYQTLYWEETTNEDGSVTKVLKARGIGEGGEGGSTGGGLSATEIKTLIEGYGYLTESKLPIASNSVKGIASFNSEQFSVINGVVSFIGSTNNTPDLSEYVTETDVNTLIKAAKGVILETWASGGGNAITSVSLGIGGKSLVIEKNITFATEEWVLEMLEGLSGGDGGSTDGTSLGVSIIGSGNAITDVNLVGNMLSFSKGTAFVEPSNFMSYLKYNSDTLGLNANGELYVKVSTGGSGGDADLSQYATKDYVINTITSNISGLASKDWVMEQIAGLNGGGSGDFPDLSAYAEKTWVDENFASNDWVRSNFASLEEINIFTKANKFNGGLFVNDKQIKYNSKGYWELDGDLLVTGGITSFASSSGFNPSTIMDGVVVDGVTIIKQNGVLVAVGGGSSDGGGSGDFPDLSAYATMDWVSLNFATSDQLSTLSGTIANKANISDVYTKTEVDTKVSAKWTTDSDKISQWDAAYGWGNHADVGYLTTTIGKSLFVGLTGDEDVQGVKNFVNGIEVNGGKLEYNSQGYWKMFGNLLVTGGITSYTSDGKESPFMVDAASIDLITSESTTQVYTARATKLIKDEVISVGVDASDALAKLEIIAEELSSLTTSSYTADIRTALMNIATKIK